MIETTSKKLEVRLPKWRKDKIRRAADALGQTISEYVLQAVDARIDSERRQTETPRRLAWQEPANLQKPLCSIGINAD